MVTYSYYSSGSQLGLHFAFARCSREQLAMSGDCFGATTGGLFLAPSEQSPGMLVAHLMLPRTAKRALPPVPTMSWWRNSVLQERHCLQFRSVAQSCPTLCDPMDCSLPGSSVHGILQARILEWVPYCPPRDLLNPGIKPTTLVSPALAGGFFNTSTTWESNSINVVCKH